MIANTELFFVNEYLGPESFKGFESIVTHCPGDGSNGAERGW